MDKFKQDPEHFLRRSATLKSAQSTESFKNYRAKTGHDAKFGKARLSSKITDLSSSIEIGETEEGHSPIVVMSARGDKRFTHDTKANDVDMNRAYKRRFSGKSHYYDIDQESVLSDVSKTDSSFKYKRHLNRASESDKKSTDAFDTPMPFMNEETDKEAVMNLNQRLMENRADATMHRGREPTEFANDHRDLAKKELESSRDHHMKLQHLKEEKQKMYFKQFSRAWDELKRNGKKKDSIFPEGSAEAENENNAEGQTNQVENTSSSNDGIEGVNAYDSG